jgi:bifunctional DNA-binding transcriptional regulator/antitoxin component of YhaV-PrlF toxin-antitoxin module
MNRYKDYIRGFDINRRIAIPRKIMEQLKLDYKKDEMIIKVISNKIILEKIERGIK